MVSLAKTLNNDPDMIKFAQIFAQQPRNSVSSSTRATSLIPHSSFLIPFLMMVTYCTVQPNAQSVQYCQTAPKNAELNGLFQCQFQGDDATVFVGGVQVGAPGTIPFGLSSPLSPPGSCAANPSGPIADGTQLVDLTQDPGVPGGAASSSPASPASSASPASPASAYPTSSTPSSSTPTAASSVAACTPLPYPTVAVTVTAAPQAASAYSASAPSATGFALANGQAAQKLNAQFATLTEDSPCTG
jgi:hypothetical protein